KSAVTNNIDFSQLEQQFTQKLSSPAERALALFNFFNLK
ncbi:hypothetical protein SA508_06695, partial [Aggregatibacter actinomycetemcomitans serotype d str. SA508]